jgi:site-specific DNA-methyltransferase (adenine-specific)
MSIFIEGDCHKEILKLEDNSVDLIYTSPPYGTTCAKWDKPLNWNIMFPELWRVLKPDGNIILHASMPFTYELLKYETPKYHYTWKKNNSTNFFKAKIQPLRDCEEVFVYYKKNGTYNPQMKGNDFYRKQLNKMGSKNSYYDIRHNIDKRKLGEGGHTGRYPTTFLEYKVRKDDTGITRPDEMMDFFIKTYTNEEDTVLDFTCHNNYLEQRCISLSRNFIGIDIDLQIQS